MAAPLAPPAWDRSTDARTVRFQALILSMRALTLLIIGLVLVLGSAGTALLIATDPLAVNIGPKRSAIVVGLLLGLPAYAIFMVVLRRRARACSVTFDERGIRLQVGTRRDSIPYADLDELRWRTDSDYARIETLTAGRRRTLLVGLAKPAPGRSAGLPPLRYEIQEWLSDAGLSDLASNRHVRIFRHESPIDATGAAD